MKPTALVLLSACVALSLPACGRGGSGGRTVWRKAAGGLVVGIHVPKDHIVQGETIQARFTVKNAGRKTARIPKPDEDSLVWVTGDGRRITASRGKKAPWIELPPGGEVGATATLAWIETGTYPLHVELAPGEKSAAYTPLVTDSLAIHVAGANAPPR